MYELVSKHLRYALIDTSLLIIDTSVCAPVHVQIIAVGYEPKARCPLRFSIHFPAAVAHDFSRQPYVFVVSLRRGILGVQCISHIMNSTSLTLDLAIERTVKHCTFYSLSVENVK